MLQDFDATDARFDDPAVDGFVGTDGRHYLRTSDDGYTVTWVIVGD